MILMRYPGGLAKALTLSYDDGVEQDIELVRILDAHGMKCTFNLNSEKYAPEGKVWPKGHIQRNMTRQQCINLFKDSPHEVAVHCSKHALLTEIPSPMIVNEVMDDRRNLERDFGGIIRSMAYPFGPCNQAAVDALRSCGILFARADRFINRKECDVYGCWLFYVWGTATSLSGTTTGTSSTISATGSPSRMTSGMPPTARFLSMWKPGSV